MRKFATALTFASIALAGVVAAPSLHAAANDDSSGSMMGHGMMRGEANDGGMMTNMRRMMNMMNHMSQMMDHCNNTMSSGRPNDQWRKNRSEPDGRRD